jgi:hypothetical protein
VTPDKLNALGLPTVSSVLDADEVIAEKLASDSVTTAKIVDGAVTGGKVAPATLTADRLAGDVGANAWLSKTANYTAVPGDRIAADTSGGAFTVTLPAAPAAKTMVTICDAAQSWRTTNLTVARNGSTIEGLSEDLTCNVAGKCVALFYTGTTWRIY